MRVDIVEKKEFIDMINKVYPNIELKNINGITIDSRKVKKDDIFIPIKGKSNDGHSFIHQVEALGGILLFSEIHPSDVSLMTG